MDDKTYHYYKIYIDDFKNNVDKHVPNSIRRLAKLLARLDKLYFSDTDKFRYRKKLIPKSDKKSFRLVFVPNNSYKEFLSIYNQLLKFVLPKYNYNKSSYEIAKEVFLENQTVTAYIRLDIKDAFHSDLPSFYPHFLTKYHALKKDSYLLRVLNIYLNKLNSYTSVKHKGKILYSPQGFPTSKFIFDGRWKRSYLESYIIYTIFFYLKKFTGKKYKVKLYRYCDDVLVAINPISNYENQDIIDNVDKKLLEGILYQLKRVFKKNNLELNNKKSEVVPPIERLKWLGVTIRDNNSKVIKHSYKELRALEFQGKQGNIKAAAAAKSIRAQIII